MGSARRISYSAFQDYDAIPRDDGDYQDIWLSSELTVNALTEWVMGSRFKDEIAALVSDANLGALGIRGDNARSVGRIDLDYPDAEGLQAIAEAVVTVLSTRSQDYFAQLGGIPAAVTVLSQTPITPAPPPLPDRFGVLIRVGLGLAAGIGLALLAHYLDPVSAPPRGCRGARLACCGHDSAKVRGFCACREIIAANFSCQML